MYKRQAIACGQAGVRGFGPTGQQLGTGIECVVHVVHHTHLDAGVVQPGDVRVFPTFDGHGPFAELTLDGRVYPAVVDGRVKWIVDGYTTSDAYPYSQMTDLGEATKDSTTESSDTVSSLNSKNANYIRNSVKATVDAYDGSVDLYVWDQSDPVIKAWEKIFPGQYHQLSEISGDLMSHMRYPESLFKVQRELLAKYHVSSANQFFSGEDFWQTPVDPTESQQAQQRDILQPPYYLTLQTGGSSEPVFSLTSSYIPAGSSTREILTGFLSVDSDAGHEKGKIGSSYGTIRLQELPKDSNVPGPGQAQNNFNAVSYTHLTLPTNSRV